MLLNMELSQTIGRRERLVAGLSIFLLWLGSAACNGNNAQERPRPTADDAQMHAVGMRILALWRDPRVPEMSKYEGKPPYSRSVTAADGTEVVAQTAGPSPNAADVEWLRVSRNGETCEFFIDTPTNKIAGVDCSQGHTLLFSAWGDNVQHEGESTATRKPDEAKADRARAVRAAQDDVNAVYRSFGLS